jgi:hypothetical protein
MDIRSPVGTQPIVCSVMRSCDEATVLFVLLILSEVKPSKWDDNSNDENNNNITIIIIIIINAVCYSMMT